MMSGPFPSINVSRRGAGAQRSRESSYGEDYYRQTYGLNRLKRFSAHWWSVRMYASVADRWLRRIDGRVVLEVGCGHGFVLSRLEQRYETFGADISEYAVGRASRFAPKSKCLVVDIEEALPKALGHRRFDLILARYVFEHLSDPLGAMKRLVRLLRPNGQLFFAVPNTESIGARWKGKQWYALKDPTHCSLLPWLQIVEKAGLKLLREFSDGYWGVPYLQRVPTFLQLPLFIAPSALACLTGRDILPARFGENICVIAQEAAGKCPDARHTFFSSRRRKS